MTKSASSGDNSRNAMMTTDTGLLTGPNGALHQRTVYLDMTDLLEYVKQNNTVSGIQRVVANLIEHGPRAAQLYGVRFELVAPEYDRQRIYAVDRARVLEMLEALHEAHRDRDPLNNAIAAVYESRTMVVPMLGDVFTIAGAFWIYDDYDLLHRLKRRGVAVVTFIHDLIQISHPEFVFEAATRQFRRTLVDIVLSSSGVLTNSRYVEQDVRRFIRDRLDIDLPVEAVPLATELAPQEPDGLELGEEVAEILSQRYVLSVSTIEIRKNHAFMVEVWERLIDEGVEPLPDLVFVGKIGWDIDPFIERLKSTANLGGKVRILNNVSDFELAELYRRASFTMYMSFVEGFGLPVAESLAHGVPCIASNRSSMPEVGGRFARYLDPRDIAGGVALVRLLIEDPAELEAWRCDVVKHFEVRTWETFTKAYMARLLAVSAPAKKSTILLSSGKIYGMGRWEVARRDIQGDKLTYLVNSRVNGWHPNEDWGCWSASPEATLAFATGLPPGALVTVYCMVKAPGSQSVDLTVEVGGKAQFLGMIPNSALWKTFDCEVGAKGDLLLTLRSNKAMPESMEGRSLYIGLLGLAFCRREDSAARLTLLETIAFDRRRMGRPQNVPRPVFTDMVEKAPRERVDAEWYLEYYPDVQLLDMAAEDHYQWIGKRMGRKPNPAALAEAEK